MDNEIKYNIINIEQTISTNIEAKQMAQNGAKEGTVVVAREQTNGKGRQGRRWLSQKDAGLYFSIILRPNMDADATGGLTPIAGIGVAKAINEAINSLIPLSVCLKWPNDIIINEKKMGGILAELTFENGKIDFIVLGIGINLFQKQFPLEIANKATSLELETGIVISNKLLLENILCHFGEMYSQYKNTSDFKPFVNEYNSLLINLNKDVIILDGKNEIRGKVVNISQFGQLIVEMENGEITKVLSGEVSVRGKNGYI